MGDDHSHSSKGSLAKGLLNRLTGLFVSEPQELSDLVETIQEAGSHKLIDADTQSMLEGVLAISKMRARDIMVPRSQMATLDINHSLQELLPILFENNHSRYPVVNEDKDHIEGILLVKDLMAHALKGERDLDLRPFLRPAVIIPESKRVDALLKEFRQKRYHMAIVLDEYGGVAGLVTIEDILEQIVGDIEDEYDEDEEFATIKQRSNHVFQVSALTPVDEFNEHFGTAFDDEEASTIGGIVLHAFGHMPEKGETIELENLVFKVSKANNRRLVQLVVITSKTAETTPEN